MAGHSKWSKVKHIKAVVDVKRGKVFSKLSKEITVAAKAGGGDQAMNPRLRSAVLTARAQNMPNDNIERAIKKGTGELEGGTIEEILYEAYAPGGVAMLIDIATDNKNRTAQDLRSLLTKNNGTLASAGSVAYLFHKKGQITVPAENYPEDQVLEVALEAGAEDFAGEEGHYVITTPPDKLYAVAEALRAADIPSESQKLTFIPTTHTVVADETSAARILRLYEVLDDYEDTQNVYANFDIPDEILAKLPE